MWKIIKTLSLCMSIFTLTLCLSLATANKANAEVTGEIYVSTTGNDGSGDGSSTNPYKTITKAINAVTNNKGATINIAAGTYNEKVTINKSGSASSPIILKGEESVILSGSNLKVAGDTSSGLITIENNSFITIDGLEICNYKASGNGVPIGIYVSGKESDITIENCKVHNISTTYSGSNEDRNAHGIAVYGTDAITNLVIENNEVYSCTLGQSESVVLNGNVSNFKVDNNVIHDNDNIGIDFIGYEGTYTDSEELDRARNGECRCNKVYNITSGKNKTYGGDKSADGIYVDGGTQIDIEDNIVSNSDIGIEVSSEHLGKVTDYITVNNNLVYNCIEFAGIVIGGADASENGEAKNITITNNTLYNNGYINGANLVVQNANSNTNIIKHNVFAQDTSKSNYYNISGNEDKANVIEDNMISQNSKASLEEIDTLKNVIMNVSFANSSSGEFTLVKDQSGFDYSKYGYSASY